MQHPSQLSMSQSADNNHNEGFVSDAAELSEAM